MGEERGDDGGVASTSERARRLAERRARGLPEPHRFGRDHTAAQVRAAHEGLAAGGESDTVVRLAGRLTLIRRHGGLTFAVLADVTGSIQLFIDRAVVGAREYQDLRDLDRGDWVGVQGTVLRTRRGELSVKLTTVVLLGKALRAPPDKDKPFAEVETRHRQRYLDLMINSSTRRIFEVRRTTIRMLREHLEARDFREVEGPMLQSVPSGAAARPFTTHHHSLARDLHLRIALELPLKQLVVGGMERVFEIGRVFRNEGLDARHNPEFTMLEAYQAFADYRDLLDLVEELVTAVARASLGDQLVISHGGELIDLTPPWPRVRLPDLIAEHTGAQLDPGLPVAQVRAVLARHGVAYQSHWGSGRLMQELYDQRVQRQVRGPVLCLDYPLEVSPLARASAQAPGYAERFELIVAGFEVCNAYSEQNDPQLQLAAFARQARARAAGDLEAAEVDLDYVRALEHGLPCTAGFGLGIDRLVMLLTGAESIREVILFPTMRAEVSSAPHPPRRPATAPGEKPAAGPTAVPIPARVPTLGPAETPAPVLAAEDAPLLPAAATPRSDWSTIHAQRRTARVIAVAAALGGVFMVLALIPAVHTRFATLTADAMPAWLRTTGHVVTVLAGLLLVLVAGQLSKQKHRAWQLSIALFAVGAIAGVVKGPHLLPVVYCLVMVAVLVANRRIFEAVPDPPSLLGLVRVVPIYAGAVLAYGLTGLFVERHRIEPALTLSGGLETIGLGLVGMDGPYTYRSHFFADFFPVTLLALGAFGLAATLYLLLRPLRLLGPHTDDEWTHAQRLVHQYGWDTLNYFALRDDKSFFFGSDGEAMVAYTYLGGYALVSGDPIGAPASVPRVLDEFAAFCRVRAWNLAFLAVREADTPLYANRGFRRFYLGDEAIIRCDRFSLDGHEMKGLRAAVRRVGREYRFQLLPESAASPELVARLNAISAKWRGKTPERGFTMTLRQEVIGDGANPDFLLCLAVDEQGVPAGFLRVVPAYGAQPGYTLDLMRHDPQAPNGMTEYLVAQTALALGERGYARLSLNFAAWGRLHEPGAPLTAAQRVQRRLGELMSPFVQIGTLRDFNAKFAPDWLPRMLVFRDPPDLPKVGLLYVGAEGFLSLPLVGSLFVPKLVGGAPAPSGVPAPTGERPPAAA